MSDALSLTVDGQVGEITFTRPDVLNRFDMELHEAFTGLLLELRARTDLRALVRGSTGTVFSAGGDFELMLAARADIATRTRMVDEGCLLFRLLADLPVPVVVALQGFALEAASMASDDLAEAIAAFKERRAPSYQGR